MTWTDPIVAEVRKHREAYAKRFGYDMKRIFADLKKSEQERVKKSSPPKARAGKKAANGKRRAA